MKVTHVSIRPTEAAEAAGRPALTPELLAASGARYSRNNEGLEAILSKIDPNQLDKSVDGIFKMIDYGHQSIADMAPIAMFIDEITMWLAYLVWAQVPTAGGQESSTRYLRLTRADLASPEELGIPEALQSDWSSLMDEAMNAYDHAYALWETYAMENPQVMRIPASLMEDPSEKAQKQVARMRRNYAFDRARYFLPVALRTNMMLVMSARSWVQMSQWLLSHYLPEARMLGEKVVEELGLSAPRLLRHAVAKPSTIEGLRDELRRSTKLPHPEAQEKQGTAAPILDVMLPAGVRPSEFASALKHHDNRYAYIGDALRRTAVRFAWHGMAFAEIRDLNRHRTGNKYCPLYGTGFYGADEEIPDSLRSKLLLLNEVGEGATQQGADQLLDGKAAYPYFYLLGTKFFFEHTTTADKFIYEAELRTGTGAHYRYAKHLRDALELWYAKYPETRGLILEGSAEPE